MFYFYDPIRKRMKRKGLGTQDELAECAKVSTGTMSKLMKRGGCNSVNMKTLTAVCNVLEIQVWRMVKEAEKES